MIETAANVAVPATAGVAPPPLSTVPVPPAFVPIASDTDAVLVVTFPKASSIAMVMAGEIA